MIEQKATVMTDSEGTIWLEAERQTTCSQCSAKKGCGTGMLSEHVGKRFSRIAIVNQQELNDGQTVHIAIPEQALLAGAFRVYIIPLICMFLAAITVRIVEWGSMAEALAGLTGLTIGFVWVRKSFKSNNKLVSQIKITEDLQ